MRRGFTLLELLVVVTIVAVIAVAAIIVLNPAQLLRQARDATRLADVTALNKALAAYQADVRTPAMGTSSVVYVSIPSASSTCGGLGLPTLPSGWSYACASTTTYGQTDGTGWVPVNLGLFSTGSPLSVLPIDPSNTTSSLLYYTFSVNANNQYQLTAAMESTKYKASAAVDGGLNPTRIEMGNDTTPSGLRSATLAYYPLDDGSGTAPRDAANAYTALASGATWVTGVKGSALNGGMITPSIPSARSISFLAYLPTGQEGTWAYFLDARPGLSTGYAAEAGIGGGWSAMYINGSSTAVNIASVPKDQWVHIYMEGASNFTDDITFNCNGSLGWEAHSGQLDEIKIFNRVLTSSEITQLYLATK